MEGSAKQDATEFAVKFLDPGAVVASLPIAAGMQVADFGCGSGFFTLALAEAIGERGAVYAFDVLPQAIELVASRAKNANIRTITARRVDLEKAGATGLLDDMLDLVVLKDILFQSPKKAAIIEEAFRVLKKGGSLAAVEWGEHNAVVGPELSRRVSMDEIGALLEAQGFLVSKKTPIGHFHYLLTAVK